MLPSVSDNLHRLYLTFLLVCGMVCVEYGLASHKYPKSTYRRLNLDSVGLIYVNVFTSGKQVLFFISF